MAESGRPPNFVLVVCDDLGYGDVEPYGGTIPTPEISRLAADGIVATDYYAPSNICTSSRAGMLTGRYPVRTGLGYEVIMPQEDRCLPLTEVTIAEALKPTYASALFGKWHLGHEGANWLPTKHGFDLFYGIPYSHDMTPLAIYESHAATDTVTRMDAELASLQQQFYQRAEQFIEVNRDRPFFVQLAFSSPHLPCYPYDGFEDRSDFGAYGDVILELDALMGRLTSKLKSLELDSRTIVIFTSDNGPWFEGSVGPLRDRKGGAGYDGGYRVPFIATGPGIRPGNLTNAIICGIDLLPTLCSLAGMPAPPEVELDGLDVSSVLMSGSPSPHDELLLFNNEDVVGVRTQEWKYVAQTYYRWQMVDLSEREYKQLYDMRSSASESYSVAKKYPDITRQMQQRLEQAKLRFAPFKLGTPPFHQQRMLDSRLIQD